MAPVLCRRSADCRIAYTKCSATKFNGFSDAHEVVYVSSEPDLKAIPGFA
jgi:hypothetical protein